MNLLERDLLDRPSVERETCVACGRPAANRHHVVFKGAGGVPGHVERRIPTLPLCGMGNCSGCHGLAHARMLHFRWRDGWEMLRTDVPAKYQEALEMPGWAPILAGGMLPRTEAVERFRREGPLMTEEEHVRRIRTYGKEHLL